MLGTFLIILACALWAADTLIRYPLASEGISSTSIVFYEHFILTIVSLVIFFKSTVKLLKLNKSIFFYFIIVGGFGSALATLAFTKAFVFLNPSLVILLQKFQPVVAITLAFFVLGEKVKKEFLLWAFVCLIGALLISYEHIESIIASEHSFKTIITTDKGILGLFLVIFSVIGWGSATVFGKKLELEGLTNEQVMAGRFITGFLFVIPFALFDSSIFDHGTEIYGKISLMVFISGILAMYLYYQGMRKISARACSLAEMFFPFMAVIVNWLFLGTTLDLIQIIGGAVLLLGATIIQIKHY